MRKIAGYDNMKPFRFLRGIFNVPTFHFRIVRFSRLTACVWGTTKYDDRQLTTASNVLSYSKYLRVEIIVALILYNFFYKNNR